MRKEDWRGGREGGTYGASSMVLTYGYPLLWTCFSSDVRRRAYRYPDMFERSLLFGGRCSGVCR